MDSPFVSAVSSTASKLDGGSIRPRVILQKTCCLCCQYRNTPAPHQTDSFLRHCPSTIDTFSNRQKDYFVLDSSTCHCHPPNLLVVFVIHHIPQILIIPVCCISEVFVGLYSITMIVQHSLSINSLNKQTAYHRESGNWWGGTLGWLEEITAKLRRTPAIKLLSSLSGVIKG